MPSRTDLQIGSDASPRPPATLTESDIYDDGYLRIEHDSFYVSCGGTVLYLPRKEFLLLSRLARSIDRIVRSEALWAHAWGEEEEFRAGTLRVYFSHLRRKLQPFGLNIKTLTSVGYCLMKSSRT